MAVDIYPRMDSISVSVIYAKEAAARCAMIVMPVFQDVTVASMMMPTI